MKKRCVFCGSASRLTREHVFGAWLADIGLSNEPLSHGVGALNQSLRDIGITQPFTRTVRDVCAACNGGWMSGLEGTAKRVLRPLILGQPAAVLSSDHAAIAAWAQKTALVAMRMLSEEEREAGYGLPESEYRQLYEIRELCEPLPASQFWIATYGGDRRISAAWVTPIVVRIEGARSPIVHRATSWSSWSGESFCRASASRPRSLTCAFKPMASSGSGRRVRATQYWRRALQAFVTLPLLGSLAAKI